MKNTILLASLVLSLSALTRCACDPGVGEPPEADGGRILTTTDASVPDAVVADPDPNDPNNAQLDSDCDGLSDAEEFGTVYASGERTDPASTDSDGDGLRDGVEAGRTSSVDPRCAGLFLADGDPSAVTDPTVADTDGDGLLDGAEDANLDGVYDRQLETDPRNPDTDGDGICDGPVAVTGVCTAGPDPTPTAAGEDADGDGLVDALDQHPNNPDSDGDGLCDGPNTVSGVCEGGEDLDGDGVVDPGESNPYAIDSDCDGLVDGAGFDGHPGEQQYGTDPSNADSDGDGLLDGVEVGLTAPADPNCLGFVADQDPSTSTDPLQADSDSDGLPDGAEDADQNGRFDDGELDPNLSSDGLSDPTAQAACRIENLIPIERQREWAADLQVASGIRGLDAFSEQARVVNPIGGGEGGVPVGLMGYNPEAKVVYLALYKDPAGSDAAAEEQFGRSRIAQGGALGSPITTRFTTWDGYEAVRASYDQGAQGGVKAQANAIVRAFYPQATGLLSEADDSSTSSGFKVQAEFVYRSGETAAVLVALIPNEANTGRAVFTLDDAANGTALAQYGDSVGTQCDRFESTGYADVDFLWAVDNSGSMGDDQAAVAAAGAEMGTILSASTMNWRMSLVTSEYYDNSGTACANSQSSSCRNFTTDIGEFTRWFSENDPWWVTTSGSGDERTLLSAMQIVRDRFRPTSTADPAPNDKIRRGAYLVIVALTDAEDQAAGFNSSSGRANNIAEYTTFFTDYDPDLPGDQSAMVGGILCAPGQSSGCDPTEPYTTNPVIHGVINNLGGVVGDLKDTSTIRPTILQILANVAGAISPYVLSKPAISATIKVAVEHDSTVGACNWDDVPRDRQNGFDYDPISRTIVFAGDCRPNPDQVGARVSVSYRYWIDQSPDANPQDGPCDICDTCVGISRCDLDLCACVCEQSVTCNAGYAWDQEACDCVCDSGSLNCSTTREVDPVACSCVCLEDCGGCGDGLYCQQSLCECLPQGG